MVNKTKPLQFSIMTTIQAIHDLHQVPVGQKKNAYLTRYARFKKGFAEWWYSSGVTAILCCVESEDYDTVVADERIRVDIRREMVRTVSYAGYGNSVKAVMSSVRLDLDYDMSTGEVVTAVAVTAGDVDVVCDQPVVKQDLGGQPRVCVVPRFAAAMTLNLRSRIGRLAPSEANQLLMEREYNRLCRAYGVRDADIAAHYCHVKNAFFGEQVFDRIPTGRSRMSRFARWAMDFDSLPSVPPQAC